MQSTPARLALLAALAAAAVVLFIVLSDSGDSGSSSDTQTSSTEAATPQVIEVKDGAPVGGVQKIEVNKGDQVNFEVKLDQPAEEVHVHGYEIEEPAQTSPVHLSFPAKLDGVFEIELHTEGGGEFQIGELTVNP
jgi:hypothetical protein